MKNLLKLEEHLLFGFALFLFSGLEYGWGWYALWFFAPDPGMIGYVMNPRLGAWTLRHAQGGAYNLIGYSSFDRVFGCDLTHEDAFQNTQLGMIGR